MNMSKLVILLVISCLCLLQVRAQDDTCVRLNHICEKNEWRVGIQDDVTKYVNGSCRRRHPNWKNVTRCQLERAACRLSLERCSELSCENIARRI